MPSRRERRTFDALTSRTFLILVGLAFAAPAGVIAMADEWPGAVLVGLGVLLMLASAYFLLAGLFAGDDGAISTAETSGNAAWLGVFYVLALGLAALMRRARKRRH